MTVRNMTKSANGYLQSSSNALAISNESMELTVRLDLRRRIHLHYLLLGQSLELCNDKMDTQTRRSKGS
jgi:hypothetical protein